MADEVSGNHAALIGEHAGHLIRVLRARVGQEFDIVAGSVVRRGRVVTVRDDRVEFELGEEVAPVAAPQLGVLLSVFKFDRMEWAIEKVTELGVVRIVPVIARRTDAHLASAAAKRIERWKRIALQATEQSRGATAPEIAAPIQLSSALSIAGEVKIVLSEAEKNTQLRSALASGKADGEILLAIGPEGGWTEDELSLFEKEGWKVASLGSTILRAETAAIAAVAIARSEIGERRQGRNSAQASSTS